VLLRASQVTSLFVIVEIKVDVRLQPQTYHRGREESREARDQASEIGSQRSEVSDQGSEVGTNAEEDRLRLKAEALGI
jgi:hypothetical protein